MEFASDNAAGVAPAILDAVVRANGGHATAYGDDAVTPFHGEAQAVGGEFPVRDHAGNEVKAGVRRLDFAQSGLRSCPIRAAPETAQWR